MFQPQLLTLTETFSLSAPSVGELVAWVLEDYAEKWGLNKNLDKCAYYAAF